MTLQEVQSIGSVRLGQSQVKYTLRTGELVQVVQVFTATPTPRIRSWTEYPDGSERALSMFLNEILEFCKDAVGRGVKA